MRAEVLIAVLIFPAQILALEASRNCPESNSQFPYIDYVIRTRHSFDLVDTFSTEMPNCFRAGGFNFKDEQTYASYKKNHRGSRATLSGKEAEKIFQTLKNRPEIPFHYPDDGCFARAEHMTRLLEIQGVESHKIFAYGSLSGNSAWTPTGTFSWAIHVAPIVNVRLDGGAVHAEVLDPPLADHPLLISDWLKKLNHPDCLGLEDYPIAPLSCFYLIADRYVYDDAETDGPKGTWPDRWLLSDELQGENTLVQFLVISRIREAERARNPAFFPTARPKNPVYNTHGFYIKEGTNHAPDTVTPVIPALLPVLPGSPGISGAAH